MKLIAMLGLVAATTTFPITIAAQQQRSAPPQEIPKGMADVPKDMKAYYLVLLVNAPNRAPNDTAEPPELMKRHLAYIRSMIEQKKIVMAGPVLDRGRFAGVGIVAAASADEANRMLREDPVVKAGRQTYEVHPVFLPSLDAVAVKY